jgi:hypothetical protein
MLFINITELKEKASETQFEKLARDYSGNRLLLTNDFALFANH